MPNKVNITGDAVLLAKLEQKKAAVKIRIDAELSAGAKAIEGEAKQRAPGDQGFLRQQITSYKDAKNEYRVASNADYSPFVEFGTLMRVSIPPGLHEYAAQFKGGGNRGSTLSAKEAIFAWCKRKGIKEELWEKIYLSIMVTGIKPHPFFFPAYNRIKPIIVNNVKKIMES